MGNEIKLERRQRRKQMKKEKKWSEMFAKYMTKNNDIQVTSVDLMKYWNEVIKEKKPKMLPGWYDISFQILYNRVC